MVVLTGYDLKPESYVSILTIPVEREGKQTIENELFNPHLADDTRRRGRGM